MEIKKVFGNNVCSEVKYATLKIYDGNTILKIHEYPYMVSPTGWDDTIALKDVRYKIFDTVLYIKGTRIFHYGYKRILDLITVWGKRNIWKINQDINSRLVDPFKEEDIVIRKWIFFNKVIKGVDSDKTPIADWYLSKEERPYEIALSNFIIRES